MEAKSHYENSSISSAPQTKDNGQRDVLTSKELRPHPHTNYFFNINFNIVFPLLVQFALQTFRLKFSFLHTPCPFHPSSFDDPIKLVSVKTSIMKFTTDSSASQFHSSSYVYTPFSRRLHKDSRILTLSLSPNKADTVSHANQMTIE